MMYTLRVFDALGLHRDTVKIEAPTYQAARDQAEALIPETWRVR